MPSSSVNPEHGLAAAADLLASYAAMPTRSPDAESFVSFPRTQDEVDALCKKYGVPKEFTARPAGDLRANSTLPPGSICVYACALEAGMRVPLHGFFREALAHFGIAPAQLTPNAWRFMAGFLALCHSTSVPPSLAVFLRFFILYAFDRKHKKGWYFFRCRRDNCSLRFRGLPKSDSSSIKDWKYEFFFLSSPEPWPCAVEWSEPSKRSLRLTVEENKSVVKLLSAHGGAAVDLRNLLPARCSGSGGRCRICDRNLAAAMITTASPPPPPPPSSIRCSKGMDPSVQDMVKTMPAEKAAASAKKRTWEEANGGEEVLPLSVLSSVPSRHDGHTTDWEAGRELVPCAVGQPLERAFAANEPTDDAAILQAVNYVIELEEKLVARERDAAALREQLEGAKKELATAKRAADAEREKARSDLAAAGAEMEKTKAELAAARAEAVKTKAERAAAWEKVVKTKAELAVAKQSAEAELVQVKAELTAAKRAAETELVKAKAKLGAAEAELESAKAAAVQQLAEDALEGYKRWRGHHAPAGRAA